MYTRGRIDILIQLPPRREGDSRTRGLIVVARAGVYPIIIIQ
jgi:hypothetical protein